MKRCAILLLFAAMSCLRAEEPTGQVFQLKYADPNQLREVLSALGKVDANSQLKTLTVVTGHEAMLAIEKLIKQFDVPPPPVRNIDVTIYLMSALPAPATTALPAEMESVVKQLKSMFSYKGYQLIDTQVIRVRAGQGGEASGVVNNGSSVGGAQTISQIKFRSASIVPDERGQGIRIDQLRVGLKVPIRVTAPGAAQTSVQFLDTGIFTDVDIRENQKVVVGKANMDGSDRASIVVLTAKVVE
ncbi:MAG TPA: hypothetical protein VL285_11555 [Bryobacteraceae bacterium]|jgi:hypothetical protein|nr:hypothetical protein [Bryobacteraceae bacterium]